eukprot:Transcript_29190.p1 GENE.Transcript_29190~~Transcript_29190.p1  ORF type:complete len:451 (-),score=158.94 Transcript_29190:47-1348(-)
MLAARIARVSAGTMIAGGSVAAFVLAAQDEQQRRGTALRLMQLDDKFRPILAAMLPAEAFVCLYSASRTPFIKALSASGGGQPASPPVGAAERVRAMGLSFRNDLGNAAGLDKDGSLLEFNYALGAGYTVVGTVLSEAHMGNVHSFLGGLWKGNAWTPLPLSGAALNSLGLPSQGVDAALANIAAFRARHAMPPQRADPPGKAGGAPGDFAGFPIGVSIMGHPAHADPQRKLDGVLRCVRAALPLADFLEVNESCPNVHHGDGGAAVAQELAARLRAIVAERDAAARAPGGRRVPILVKLGDLGDPKETVRFLAKVGIDGLVALNTQKDYDAFELPEADKALLAHYTQRYGGGLSGPPVLPRSTAQAAAAQAAVRELKLGGAFTVVHVGGLQSAADMARSRETGVELRQWYTGLMHGLAQGDADSLYARVTQR